MLNILKIYEKWVKKRAMFSGLLPPVVAVYVLCYCILIVFRYSAVTIPYNLWWWISILHLTTLSLFVCCSYVLPSPSTPHILYLICYSSTTIQSTIIITHPFLHFECHVSCFMIYAEKFVTFLTSFFVLSFVSWLLGCVWWRPFTPFWV